MKIYLSNYWIVINGKPYFLAHAYVDFNTRTIYELKPMNPRGARSGISQLQKYNKALGGGFDLRLELY